MFANILYFLIALVIYTTAELFEPVAVLPDNSLINAVLLSLAFVFICKFSFDRLAKKAAVNSLVNLDQWIGAYINRLSLLALAVFATNLYGFKLYSLFSGTPFFNRFPTIEAIIFLSLFLGYLIAVWTAAYTVQRHFFPSQISRREFILSNLSFSLPALLPWFVLSIVSDLLGFLPWQPVKEFLRSPAGEIGYIAVFLVAIAIFGPVLIKTLWKCKSLEPGVARSRIEFVCKQTGLKYADILRWELFGGTMITAGVMGLVGRFRYILVTPALLNSLTGEELDAVMLHEIGHVQKHHMVFYLLFFGGFVACNFVFFEPILFLLYLFEPVYHVFEMVGIQKTTAHPVLFSTTLILTFVLYFRFVFGYYMRNFERQADLHMYRYTSDASPLISTFYKIASYSHQSMEKPNWHHFSIGRRVRFLEKCQQVPELIKTHHLKVKKMMLGYLVAMALIFAVGYSISYGVAKDRFEEFVAQRILLQELAVDPGNADIYALVGDYYLSRSSYQKAIDAYENVLKVAPDHVHALNNLAWLLLTSTEESYRDKERALVYAEKAISIERDDYILDTYAEALFVNNRIESAVAAAREALAVAETKKEYYQKQLEKFEGRLFSEETSE